MTLTYPLPQDTRQTFEAAQYRCSNLSLLLDKYIGYKQDWKLQEEQKIELFKNIASNFRFENNLIQHRYQRWEVMVKSFPHAKLFKASPEWRMVVGLGQTSILETSMTLDRITGIPIILGSALKGLAASYAMLCVLEQSERLEAEKNETFKAIFGTQEQSGKVIFLDAVPVEVPTLEPDIMNNHYQEYYSDTTGNKAPTPYQNPVPVYFLTLGKKSQFAFALAGQDKKLDTKGLVEQAELWLKGGLSEFGIGAKTSAGYGYMNLA